MKVKIEPKIFKNICLTAHPEGCYQSVLSQVDYIKAQLPVTKGPKNVLILGSSTGYGLASRITSAFGSKALTIGVSFEKEGTDEVLGSVGWYNTLAFTRLAREAGLKAHNIFGDAFAEETKQNVIDLIRSLNIKIDLVIYSLAAPRRTDPVTGEIYNSAIKPIGESYSFKTLDMKTEELYQAQIDPATDEEIKNTVKVMGGEDWQLWIEALNKEGLLAPGVKTAAYSYIGPEFTQAIYRSGTLGKAKEHLETTAHSLNRMLEKQGGNAYISVNKALITRASAVIPAVPIYICLLYRIMKAKEIHENCIHQIYRLFDDFLYNSEGTMIVDSKDRIRLDDYELQQEIQEEVSRLFFEVQETNYLAPADLKEFRDAFLQFHGFGQNGINYQDAVELSLWTDELSSVK